MKFKDLVKKVNELEKRLNEIKSKEKQEREKITLDEFWNSNEELAIHCDTEEKANILCEEFDRMGRTWGDGDDYLKNTHYEDYTVETCYSNEGMYLTKSYCLNNDIKIYEFEDVILPEEPKHEFKVGDRVQFKTWEEMEKEFGLDEDGDIVFTYTYFIKQMRPLCGTYATISKIDNTRQCRLTDFTTKIDNPWNYCLDMLKPAVDESKNEPKWTFTEDEKVILRNVDEDYKWIARDKSGTIYLYREKPIKEGDNWTTNPYSWEAFTFFNHLFKTIKWKDDNACEFRKYI